MHGRAGTAIGRPGNQAAPWWTVVAAGYALFLLIAVLFAARRLAGELREPLPASVFLGSIFVAAATAFALRQAHGMTRDQRSRPARVAAHWLPTAALALIAITLTLPGTHVWAISGAAIVVAGEEFLAWRARGVIRPRSARPTPSPPEADEVVLVEMTLTRSPATNLVWRGAARAELAARQRSAIVHIAFCPPFIHAPLVTAEQSDGPPAQVTVDQVLPHGARIALRTDREPIEPVHILIEFVAEQNPDAVRDH